MQRTTFLRMGAALLVAAALALSGCGGDDNGGLSAEDMARIDNAEMAAAAAMAAQTAAEAEAAEAEAARMAAVAEAATAEAARMAAVAEAMDAMAMATQAAEDQKDAEDARDAAIAAQGVAETARDAAVTAAAVAESARMDAANALAAANMTIEELRAELADQPYDPSDPGGTRDGAEGRAAAWRIYHSVYRNQNEESPNYLVATGMRRDASASAEHGRLGYDPTVSVSVSGGSGLGTDDDDTVVSEAPAIAGFDGTALEKDGPGPITQMALVYTDVQPSVRAWGDVYRYNTTLEAGVPVTTPSTSETNRTHLLIGTTTAGQSLAEFDAKIDLTGHGLSTTSGVTSRDLTAGDTIAGEYDDVAGHYVFSGTPTLELDGDDLTIDEASIVAFRADNPDELIPDQDYLTFGVWANIPDDPTNANPGMVRPFASGSATAFDIENVNALSGMAEYSGGAVGHWATRAAGSHLVDEGRFTASASLEADFDAAMADYVDDDNFADGNTISATPTGAVLTGTITDFMTEDGTEMPGWRVNLHDGTMTPDVAAATAVGDGTTEPMGPIGREAAAFDEVDIIGSTSGSNGSLDFSGVWISWLHGNNTESHPTGVVGNFQASAGNPAPITTNEGRINLFEDLGFAGVVGAFAGTRD